MSTKNDPQIESSASASSNKKNKDNDFLDNILAGGDPDIDNLDFDDLDLDMPGFYVDDDLDSQLGDNDEDEFVNDDELTNMLDSTKEARKRLKTGAPEEFENDFADFEDNLLATATVGKKRSKALKRVGQGEARLPKEVSQLLGRANEYYLNREYGKAIDVLQETITQYPNLYQPWNTLGLVHEEMGNTTKSLEVRMVAAHMSANDASLWKELGLKSIHNNAKRQAIYCFDKAAALDPLDVDVLWDRAFLEKDMGRLDAAMNGFRQILEILPFHFKVINELAQLYRIQGHIKIAITLYEDAMAHHVKHARPTDNENIDEDDLGFSDKLGYPEINMLSELYLMVNDYRRALDCIKTGARHVQQRQHELQWLDRPDDDDEYLPVIPRRKLRQANRVESRSRRKTRSSNNNNDKKQDRGDNGGDNNDVDNDNDDEGLDESYVPDSGDDDSNDDSTYSDENVDGEDEDDDELENEASLERQNIPLELRVRMGVCRIYLGQEAIAGQHFEYLYRQSPSAYHDLYQDVACAYMDRRFFDKALGVFQRIIDEKEEVEVDLLVRTAECYREVGDLETAIVFFVNVLDEQPENLEVMTSLAMVYEEQGKEDEALELVDYVVRKTREIRKNKRLEALADGQTADDVETNNTEELAKEAAERLNETVRKKGSLFDENLARQQLKAEKDMQREQKRREEEERQMEALKLYEKINELHSMIPPLVVETDRNVMREYIRVAQQLWEDFRTTPAFFPNKQRISFDGIGFYASRNKKTKNDSYSVHEARTIAARLRQRQKSTRSTSQDTMDFTSDNGDDDEGDDEDEENEESSDETYNRLLNSDHFRNIWLDDWIDMFIKLSYMLTTLHRSEEAFTILRTAIASKPVYTNPVRKTILKMTLLGCGTIAKNRSVIIDVARWVCNTYQFENDTYRIYGTIFPSGWQNKLDFGPMHALKYFSRNIKLMDGLHAMYMELEKGEPVKRKNDAQKMKELQDVIRTMQLDPATTTPDDYERYYNVTEQGSGNDQIRDWMEPLSEVSPLLITLFGHILMIGSNFLGASLFYMRAYALAPNDPLITLSLAIANLLRSTQRKTDDRHLQIIKGMQMLSHYCKLRNHNQESEYNLARAFHLLNLTHLAIPHYERVLILPSAAKQGLYEPKSIDDVYTWPVTNSDDFDDDDDETDLKREAAYNLHLIYMTSGATSLAQIVLLKYCSI